MVLSNDFGKPCALVPGRVWPEACVYVHAVMDRAVSDGWHARPTTLSLSGWILAVMTTLFVLSWALHMLLSCGMAGRYGLCLVQLAELQLGNDQPT